MSEQDKTSDWQDDGLTRLYQKAHQELPDAESDRAILQAAQKYSERQKTKPRSIRWAVPLATAASLLLVANLVWLNYDWQPVMQPDFETEHYEAAPQAEIQQRAERKQVPIARQAEAPAVAQKSEEKPLVESYSKEKRIMAKKKQQKIIESERMASQMAESSTLQDIGEDVSDIYGMNREINDFFVKHLSSRYQPVEGRHFVMADFNQDGIADWAGLMGHTRGHIELLVVLSHRQSYQHHILGSDFVGRDQLMHSGTHLRLVTGQESKLEIVLTVENKIVHRYYWNGNGFVKSQ